MRKRLLVPVMMICVIFSMGISGCSGTSESDDEINYQDDEFISDLQKGLELRWDTAAKKELEDDAYYTDKQKEYYGECIHTELDILEQYVNKEFKDSKLKEKAIAYVNSLKDQEEALQQIGIDNDKFDAEWQDAYDERTKLIVDFVTNYGLSVDEAHQKDLSGLMTNGQQIVKSEKEEKQIRKMVKKIQFEQVSNDFFKEYEAIVENTTDIDFSSFSLDINLFDGDGIIIESSYASVSNFRSGSKAKFSFSTTEDFATYVIEDYDYYKDE